MTAFILAGLLKFWPIIAGVLGLLGVGIAQRRAGAAKERARQAASERRARDIADQVDNDIGALTPEQARERLRQWSKR